MRRRTILPLLLGFAAIVAALAPSAEAQVTATAVLKSGQRHTGTNLGYRLDERQVVVRTSQAEEPRIPVDQVAYVDFGGTADPVNMNLSGSQEAVVHARRLHSRRDRSSSSVTRTRPISRVGTSSSSGTRTVRSAACSRARSPACTSRAVRSSSGSTATAGGLPSPRRRSGYTVSAQQAWSPTGIVLNRGEVFTVNASGEISIGAGDNAKSTPNGTGRMDPASVPCQTCRLARSSGVSATGSRSSSAPRPG